MFLCDAVGQATGLIWFIWILFFHDDDDDDDWSASINSKYRKKTMYYFGYATLIKTEHE